MSTAGNAEPYLTIRPRSGWAALNLLEVWQFRDLLFSLAGRDLKLRYRQTALGAAWVILQPLMAAGIFSFVFGSVAKLPSHGVPRFLFTYAGLLAWNAFSSTLGRASTCLVGSSQLVSKVYFPRLVLPLSTLVSTFIDIAVAFAMMLVLMALYRQPLHWVILLLPVWMGLICCLAMGAGLYASALMVSYRDVGYIVPVLTQFLLYASPVAYALADVPANLQSVYVLNPLCSLLEAFRGSILGMDFPAIGSLVYAAIVSILAFVIGAFAFRKMERRFADVI